MSETTQTSQPKVAAEVDRDAGAVYFRFSTEPVGHTSEVSDRVLVDVSENGGVVGIEVLGLDPLGALDDLADRWGLDPEVRALLGELMLAASKPFTLTNTADAEERS